MADMDGKKTEAITVKVSDDMHRFVEIRSRQRGFESAGEYIRSLLEADHRQALSDFNLLSMALGVDGNSGNAGNSK
jgi:hypothetical protein